MADRNKLKLTLREATAVNMIDMVGIGPFIVLPLVIVEMGGPQSLVAWAAGALLAYADAFVWSELGAAMPKAGGSYVFLRETYGRDGWGKFASFLFIWQTVFQASFVVASGAIGFTTYFSHLFPLEELWQKKIVSAVLILAVVAALYRDVKTIGKLSVFMTVAVLGTFGWIIVTGALNFNSQILFSFPDYAWNVNADWMKGLGDAMQQTVYAFLGYYNICHLGGDIENPQKNIPKSMFISISAIAFLYLAMHISVLSVIPWQTIQPGQFLLSIFIEKIYGSTAATIMTGLILFIAFTSLFAVVLGYSRIPYAAAKDGNFFAVFSRLHPKKHFPHISLLVFGGVSLILSLIFDNLKIVVAIILTMRILVQFVGQTIGLFLYRKREGVQNMPFKMPLFPIPAIIGIGAWIWLFGTRQNEAIAYGVGMALLGAVVYYVRTVVEKYRKKI